MQGNNQDRGGRRKTALDNMIESLSGHDNAYIRSLAMAHPLRRPVLDMIFGAFELDGRGVDVGCGIGLPAVEAALKGLEVTGLDGETEFLETAEIISRTLEFHNALSFVKGDAADLNFKDNTFDWAMSIDCVNYAKGLGQDAVSQMIRVIRPGGRLVLAAWSSQVLLPGYPLLEARLNATARGLAPFEKDMDPNRHFLVTAGMCEGLGLEDIQCRTFVRDIAGPLTKEIQRALADLFDMRWGKKNDCLDERDMKLYTALTDPASARFLPTQKNYCAFFTYTVFSGIKK